MLEKGMLEAAEALEFEKAATLRDRIAELKAAPELTVTDTGIARQADPPPQDRHSAGR